ncbi:MAG: helix-turn-helix transcriptional regulator [Oscillospiraceae bacterium]|nr:helix-turn-helix transcriptional regulator [Oscillospiraceae bacterium]
MPKKILTEQEKKRAYELCEIDGKSQKKVADFYGVSQSTISNIIKEQRYIHKIDKLDQVIQSAAYSRIQQVIEDRIHDNPSIASIEYNVDED